MNIAAGFNPPSWTANCAKMLIHLHGIYCGPLPSLETQWIAIITAPPRGTISLLSTRKSLWNLSTHREAWFQFHQRQDKLVQLSKLRLSDRAYSSRKVMVVSAHCLIEISARISPETITPITNYAAICLKSSQKLQTLLFYFSLQDLYF